MDKLVQEDGDWKTEVEEVQAEVTRFMEKWLYGGERHHQGVHSREVDWGQLYEDRPYFMEKARITGVPEDLLDLLWRALQSTRGKLDQKTGGGGKSLREEREDWLMAAPTNEEWKQLCRRTGKRGKASGLTGLTYDMVKNLPDSVIKRTHEIMTSLWKCQHIPECAKWKWLALIPKVARSAKLTDMRPI